MVTLNGVMAIACVMGQEFKLIFREQHVISNYRPIKGMMLVNRFMAPAC
jgi:hypothetical protein